MRKNWLWGLFAIIAAIALVQTACFNNRNNEQTIAVNEVNLIEPAKAEIITPLYETYNGATEDIINPGVRFIDIATGGEHSFAIGEDGSLWAWGRDRLGNGTMEASYTPIRIGNDYDWALVSVGWSHAVAIKTDGSLWAWGANWGGRLGDGTRIHRDIPVRIGDDFDWVSASAGSNHTVAIKADGSLWAWGDNDRRALGLGIGVRYIPTPTQIGTELNWISVSAGTDNTVAIKTDGSLWAWGDAGIRRAVTIPIPTRIGTDSNWKFAAAGGGHRVAIKTDGSLWAWGRNEFGDLGDGTTIDRHSPVQITRR